MTTAAPASNPFALMMNPEAVFAALERSDRLARLQSRICRPLDKPLIAHSDADADADAFDRTVDALDESVAPDNLT